MVRLLRFIYSIRVLLVFLFLETWSFILIKNNSPYFSASFFTSSNNIAARILDFKTTTFGYFNLVEQNELLRAQNAELHKKNLNALSSYKYNRLSFKNNYEVQKSKVINNSVSFSKNYLTIDVGIKEGVKTGMGVIGADGIIGMVKSVSNNFATVTSILHTKMDVSVLVGKERVLASLSWNGKDYRTCEVIHLPKHVKVSKGDTIYSSGYGGIFPEEIVVGIVSAITTEEDKMFHQIEMSLINNFNSLKTAYVVIDKQKKEKITIENE